MFDFARNEFHQRHIFYLDTSGQVRLLPEYHLARLHAGEPDAALPSLAGEHVRLAIFRVEHLSTPMRIIDEYFPVLPFDATGNLDTQLDYDTLQATVDRLEAHDYVLPLATGAPDDSTPCARFTPGSLSEAAKSLTAWVPDSFTHRRLIAALLDSHHQPWPAWWPQNTHRAA